MPDKVEFYDWSCFEDGQTTYVSSTYISDNTAFIVSVTDCECLASNGYFNKSARTSISQIIRKYFLFLEKNNLLELVLWTIGSFLFHIIYWN